MKHNFKILKASINGVRSSGIIYSSMSHDFTGSARTMNIKPSPVAFPTIQWNLVTQHFKKFIELVTSIHCNSLFPKEKAMSIEFPPVLSYHFETFHFHFGLALHR